MERLNLTPRTIKVLPVTIGDKDYDLKIDTRDITLTSLILNMADDAQKLEDKIKDLSGTKDIEKMRKIANEAIDKSDEFYANICSLIPELLTYTEGKPIRDFRVWAELLYALASLVTEGKAENLASDTIEAEESDAIR